MFGDSIDWQGKATNLKATFALTASNLDVTYNEDVERGAASQRHGRQFEVMSQRRLGCNCFDVQKERLWRAR
jgi:hypothetical protein